MSGWKDWAIGEVVTESDFQAFVQDQVVQVYDDATARDNTLGTSVTEGMMAYLKDTDVTQVYNGTAWISTVGDITGVTAGTALTGGGTAGDVTLDVDISALATAHAGNALNANGELLDVDESAITLAQSQVTDLVSDLADKADNADFTGGTAGYTALSNGTAGLSYQPVSHNYIINGAFDIWQRGETFTGLTTDQYTADRWRFQDSGGTTTITKEDFTADELVAIGYGEAKSYLKFDATTGDNNLALQNRIEDVRSLAGQTATLSFWAKGTNPSPDGFVRVGIDQFLPAFLGSVTDTITLTASWQRFSITYNIPDLSGQTISDGSFTQVTFSQQSSGTTPWELDIWGVQLEAGSVATPFKRNANSIQGELAACQRYYWQVLSPSSGSQALSNGYMYTSTQLEAVLRFPTTMRAVPSLISGSGTGAFKFDRNGAEDLFDDFFGAQGTTQSILIANNTDVSGTAGQAGRIRSATTDGSLALDAEL